MCIFKVLVLGLAQVCRVVHSIMEYHFDHSIIVYHADHSIMVYHADHSIMVSHVDYNIMGILCCPQCYLCVMLPTALWCIMLTTTLWAHYVVHSATCVSCCLQDYSLSCWLQHHGHIMLSTVLHVCHVAHSIMVYHVDYNIMGILYCPQCYMCVMLPTALWCIMLTTTLWAYYVVHSATIV